jgi:hypothetical protein
MDREWTVVDISHICPHKYLKKGPKGQEKKVTLRFFSMFSMATPPQKRGGENFFQKKTQEIEVDADNPR